MKIAVISDTHFGDPMSVLVPWPAGAKPGLDPRYFDLLQQSVVNGLGRDLDYLVLLGDILDFSVNDYESVYQAASVFFGNLARQKKSGDWNIREIIYLPGNHDFSLWHTVEHQVNVVRGIDPGGSRLPRSFRWSVPGVIDDRIEGSKLCLPHVTRRSSVGGSGYGELFLDILTQGQIKFNVAYPNLYVVTSDGECVLLTHGHYFVPAWAILGERVPYLLEGDALERLSRSGLILSDRAGGEPLRIPSLRDFVSMNFPVGELLSTGLGMAGPMTSLVRHIQRLAKDIDMAPKCAEGEEDEAKIKKFQKQLDRIDDQFLDPLVGKGIVSEVFWDQVISFAKRKVLDAVKEGDGARNNETFVQARDVQKRIFLYLKMTEMEIEEIAGGRGSSIKESVTIPFPRALVFGHTHQPTAWGEPTLRFEVGQNKVSYSNTGSFLYKVCPPQKKVYEGADVLMYETGRGFFSRPIR